MLTRDSIKNIDDTKYQVIRVKAWNNEEVKIKTLTAAEQLEMAKTVEDDPGLGAIVKIVMLSVVDDNNNKVFLAGDEEFLREKNFNALLEISDAATKLGDISVEAVEEKAKN